MTALNTDLLKKLSRKWVGQIGAAGVTDAVGTTIPLSSTTNLATDTAVVATIDRVDANGTKTPTLEETVIGVVSGSNLVNSVRGSEGTAQAHAAGAVVEILVTAKGYNDIIDHLLVQHSQLGVHTSALVTTLKATGATINTGTDDTTIVTPKAIADSNIPTATSTLTFTNKRITKRIGTETSSSASAINSDSYDQWNITALAAADTIAAPSGTPTNGQTLIIRIKDAGVAKALDFNAVFRFSTDLPKPTTTVVSKTMYLGFVWNAADSVWDCLAIIDNL